MTLTEKAYQSLRHDIVRGSFQPGQPLRMAEVSRRYGMGFSPLREALNRLHSERLVVSVALRGFTVAELSLEEMWDAIKLRILIEGEALRASIQKGGDEWEARIVAALHQLTLQAGRTTKGNDEEIWELEARHRAFHHALISACGSKWMLEFFDRLYADTERYRIPILLEKGYGRGRDVQSEHAELSKAALARDAERATALLSEHYRRTAETIERRMRGDSILAPTGTK
jgi:DNA-binding GntR family transcriptional regulator